MRTVLDRSEWPVCQCNAEDPCKNECLNKMLYYECSPVQCPNKENCKNQRIQKFEYMNTKMFRCEEKGWGLKADQGTCCFSFLTMLLKISMKGSYIILI